MTMDAEAEARRLQNSYSPFIDGPSIKCSIISLETRTLPDSSQYTVYNISTDTTMPSYTSGVNPHLVSRRYSEFVVLRERLLTSINSLETRMTIPPLPGDTWSSLIWTASKFDEQFLKARRQGLQSFLDIIVNHPAVQYNDELRLFLSDQDHGFSF